jgi:hypothetical protein
LNLPALKAFGQALHAEMDNLSPAHTGCQEFSFRVDAMRTHSGLDSYISPEQLDEAVRRAQELFIQTFGYPGAIWGMNQFDLLELFWRQFEQVTVKLSFGPVVN